MSDTTIDEILGQLLGKASVEFMSHPDGRKIIMPAEELFNYQREAKSALYDLILKEVIGEDIPLIDERDNVNSAINAELIHQRNKLKELFDGK